MSVITAQSIFQIGICFRPIEGDGVNFRFRNGERGKQLHFYYENICVNFASIRNVDTDLPLVLFTTEKVPTPYQEILQILAVEIRIIPQIFRVDPGFSNKYLGSLFILDCIFEQTIDTLYIDPDVICISNIELIRANTQSILAYNTFEKRECKDGIATIQKFLHESLLSQEEIKFYYGGEFYFIPKTGLAEIRKRLEALWKINNQAFKSGKTYLQTEEHILTLALHNMSNLELTDSIQRLWTTRSYREIRKDFRNMTFLHLPAEKDTGLSSIYNVVFKTPTEPNFSILAFQNREVLFRMLHITQSTTQKFMYRLYRVLKRLKTSIPLQN
jgi:hypothetical protein